MKTGRNGYCLVMLMAWMVIAFAFLFIFFGARQSVQMIAQSDAPWDDAGPKATIVVGEGLAGELTLRRVSDNATRSFSSTNGVFEVPVGRYQLWYYTGKATDANGAPWAATSGLDSRDKEAFDLVEGAVRRAPAGPPFVASVRVTRRGSQLRLDLRVAGAAGDTYRIRRERGRTANPTYTIRDAAGREIARGNFEYG